MPLHDVLWYSGFFEGQQGQIFLYLSSQPKLELMSMYERIGEDTQVFNVDPERGSGNWATVLILAFTVSLLLFAGLSIQGATFTCFLMFTLPLVWYLVFLIPRRELMVKEEHLTVKTLWTSVIHYREVEEMDVKFTVSGRSLWDKTLTARVLSITLSLKGRLPVFLNGEHFSVEQLNQIYSTLRSRKLLREGARWSRYYLRQEGSPPELVEYDQGLAFLDALCQEGGDC